MRYRGLVIAITILWALIALDQVLDISGVHKNAPLQVVQASGKTLEYRHPDATLTCSGPITVWSTDFMDVLREDGSHFGVRPGQLNEFQFGHYQVRPRDFTWGDQWLGLTVRP